MGRFRDTVYRVPGLSCSHTLSRFDKTPTCEVATAIDRADHGIYRTSTVSCGNIMTADLGWESGRDGKMEQ